MLCCAYRDPISIFISSWDYYGYENVLEMNIEVFAYAIGNGLLYQCWYQLLQFPNINTYAKYSIFFFLNS